MKHYYKLLFTFIVSCLFSIHSNAQSYLGLVNSNYAGVIGNSLQPASFVDGRLAVDVNLMSVNLGVWQNAKYFDTKNMPKWWTKSFQDPYTAWMKPDSTFYKNNFFNVKNPKGKDRGLNLTNEIDLLNFMFHIGRKRAVGFSAKMRNNISLTKFSPQAIQLIENGMNFQPLFNVDLKDEFIAMDQLSWAEFGFNYSQIVMDENEHFLKAGINFKLLKGIASTYFRSSDLSYNIKNSDTANYLKGTFDYGYSNMDGFVDGKGMDKLFSSKLGVGLDLGVVYEWRPDWKIYKYDMDGQTNLWRKDQEKYKLRAGISVLDIGGMKFQKGQYSRNFRIDVSGYDLNKFSKIDDFKSFDSLVKSDYKELDDSRTFFMNLPTAISTQLDYHIWEDFYVNLTGYFNLVNFKKAHRVSAPTQLSITPRYDYKWMGLFIPFSWSNYSGFKIGTALRLGPIFMGIADWRPVLATGKVRGAELYFGVNIPILRRHPKDKDGDKVSDKVDKCKDVPGVWTFMGCPDTDGDGIQDSEDECPTEAGLKEFHGCPDRDGDGIPDKDDMCPDDPGLKVFQGCPDRDNDSIPDKDDKCPDEKGLKEFGGCPDIDGDGIQDSEDDCPTIPGLKEFHGCPDTDGDGIPDKDDECPTLAGPLENKGCPYQDTDGDGVLDKDDQCPTVKGPASNHGCPVIEEEVKKILKTAFDNLEFETAKAIIKDVSKPSLDELAGVLKEKPEWRLQISGHTDNVGKPQDNLILSKERAEAVRDYLSSKGIDPSRFSVLYFGQTQPIAPNDTPEGRQKNRRVEMEIIFK